MTLSFGYAALCALALLCFWADGADLHEDGKVLLRLKSNLADPQGNLRQWRAEGVGSYCMWPE